MRYTGVTHIHSTYSHDAALSLRDLKELFSARGISFVCMTEHDEDMNPQKRAQFIQECAALSDEHFLFIPGVEIDTDAAHLLHIGITETQNRGSFVVLAHPHRSHFSVSPDILAELHGVEVWNSQYDGTHAPRSRALSFFALLQKEKPTLVPCAGLDLHRSEHVRGPVLTITMPALSTAAVISALHSGSFMIQNVHAHAFTREMKHTRLHMWSMISVVSIQAMKWISTVCHVAGIRIPHRLREYMREKL